MIESYLTFGDSGAAAFVPASTAEMSAKYARKLSDFPDGAPLPLKKKMTVKPKGS
jgi:hypothetical protein